MNQKREKKVISHNILFMPNYIVNKITIFIVVKSLSPKPIILSEDSTIRRIYGKSVANAKQK
jgi:hypothetical protein